MELKLMEERKRAIERQLEEERLDKDRLAVQKEGRIEELNGGVEELASRLHYSLLGPRGACLLT